MKAQFNHTLSDLFLDQKRLKADPEADLVIQKLVDKHGTPEARRIFDTLIREVEMPMDKLPQIIQQFVRQQNSIPGWANPQKIALAQQLFIDHGPKFLMFLYFKSLPLLYSMKNGVKVLVETSRLSHDHKSGMAFSRRIAETGQFLLEVMAPEGFKGNKPAVFAALKIRLIHAAIRHFIPTEYWNEPEWGKPINQEDLAATLMTFSVAMTEGLKQFNLTVSKAEEDAYLHYWLIIGSLMGIDEDLLPQKAEDGLYLLDAILSRQSAHSEEGVLLTKALTTFVSNRVESGILKTSPHVMIRFLTGKQIAGRLGVKRKRFWWLHWLLPAFLKIWFGIGERLEDRVKSFEYFSDQASKMLVRNMVKYFDSYKQRYFHLPDSLRRKWFQ